jgi:hypothetical protein
MANTGHPSPDGISASEFQSFLEKYPACIAAISESKGGTEIHSGSYSVRLLIRLFHHHSQSWPANAGRS